MSAHFQPNRIRLPISFSRPQEKEKTGIYPTPFGALVVSHGAEDGHLEDWAEEYLKACPSAYVTCCFASAVRKAHPQARVIGAWPGSAYWEWVGDWSAWTCELVIHRHP